jgi:hypothetical protein
MVQLFAEVKGATELQQDLLQAQRDVPKRTRDAMETSLLLIERDARAAVPQDTRALMGSISSTIASRAGALEGTVGPSKRYGYFVEYGRRPGKMPPLQAIEGWARRHGLNPFLVARAIGRRGVKARPFMLPALEKNEKRIFDLFAQAGARIAARIAGR